MRKRFLPIFLIAVLCVALGILPSLSAFAVSAESGSLTIGFRHEEQPIEGADFSVFRVARAAGGGYTLTGAFADYPVVFPSDPDVSDWNAVAVTLASYVASDNIPADASGTTNQYGVLTLTDLPLGLYLVTGEPILQGDTLYIPQPLLISVPYTANGNSEYDVSVDPKYEFRTETGEKLERRVLKIWADNGYEKKRPNEITVQLLCDGEVYDEQTLNAANNWRYIWSDLDPAHNWQLLEKTVPENYTVLVEQQGVTFTVTNTYKPTTPPASTTPPETLPQTGMLWWPVPVMAACGILLCAVGIFLQKRRKSHD